jgi:predicted component of type VI protein secretion system
MPRFLSRLPYGAKTNPVEEFNFEEDTGAADHSKYTWANAAYAMAVNINRSFKAVRLVLAHPRHRIRRCGAEGLPRTPSPPTTAAST